MTCDEFRLRLSTVAGYSDEHFAAFLLNNDPLAGRLTAAERREIITGAVHSGADVARELSERFAAKLPAEVACLLGVKIVAGDLSGARLVLSNYDSRTATITLNRAMLEKLEQCQVSQALLPGIFNPAEVAVAHELFHHMESGDKGVFSRQFKVTLWRLGRLRYRSTVAAAGEIAATVCAKTFCRLRFNPVLLEAVALYMEDAPRLAEWFDRLDHAV
jgi:hypothetical protein